MGRNGDFGSNCAKNDNFGTKMDVLGSKMTFWGSGLKEKCHFWVKNGFFVSNWDKNGDFWSKMVIWGQKLGKKWLFWVKLGHKW